MFSDKFKRRYALTDKGLKNTKQATFWTVIVNLVMMGGIGILYYMMNGFMSTFQSGKTLPNVWLFIGMVVLFLVLSLITHLEQYKSTYGLVYNEVKDTRLALAERLRRLPLGYFGKRDLADLTETIMGDVNRLEHVWSHCLGYLYGAFLSTAIVAVGLIVYDWRLAIACLWGVPVAFALLFGSRKISKNNSEKLKTSAVSVSDGIQESIENIREIRATNQETRFLEGLNKKIDAHEKMNIKSELVVGLFVNAASVIMRLGVATTILTGVSLILSGKIDFMLLFMFLLVITRVYAPFDQSLALIAEMFVSQVSANRLNEIYETPIADGSDTFEPKGHDIVFENVSFSYDGKPVLKNVSFTANEGEIFGLLGPNGAGKTTTLRVISTLLKPTKGEVLVQGHNTASEAELARTDICFLTNELKLDPKFTPRYLFRMFGRLHGMSEEDIYSRQEELFNIFGIVDFQDKKIEELSTGMKQKASIAVSLVHDPKVVIFDEPTNGLDIITARAVTDYLFELKRRGKAVIVSTHIMSEAQKLCDRIAMIIGGRNVMSGTLDEILNATGTTDLEDAFFAVYRTTVTDENELRELNDLDKQIKLHGDGVRGEEN